MGLRDNHRCSELRRFDFPKIGHFDTWLIDQLQNLVMQNRDTQLFPNWSNASDYKTTDESFDTIALHSQELHDALMDQWDTNIIQSDVKLTFDQKYICKAMGVKLPFLPFATEEEKKQFAQCVLDPSFPARDDAAAVSWCKFVDGVNIHPKLPVHIRNYREQFERNERVRQSAENARAGNEKLSELNAALTTSTNGDSTNIPMPRPMPDPLPQAMHTSPYVVVGGIAIGQTPIDTPNPTKPRGKDKKKRKRRECQSCESNSCQFYQVCSGRGPRGKCAFFDDSGNPIFCDLCKKYDGVNKETCRGWIENSRGGKRQCIYFEQDGTPKE